MAKYLVASTIILPDLPVKIDHSISTSDSPQSSTHTQYFTPRSSLGSTKASSDSSSTLTDHSSNEGPDHGDFVNISVKKHVRFGLSPPTFETHVKIEDNEAEFFVIVPPEKTTNNTHTKKNSKYKSTRKRDKIRSLFHKKYSRSSSSDTSDADTHEWGEMLAKSLITIHQDVQEIISGIDEIDQPTAENSLSTTSEAVITAPRLSFRERQRAKIEMMRMSQILHPPNLLTYNMKESPYPYTDIVAPHNYNLLHSKKPIPSENLLVQHKPIRHEKLRYRTQRALLKMRRDLKQLKRNIHGKSSSRTHKELISFDVQNYRTRLEKTLREVRTQIDEYDRTHASINDYRQSISQIVVKMKAMDPVTKEEVEDYRTKLRPMQYVEHKRKNDLLSAPFIPRRTRFQPGNTKKDDNDHPIDARFDPTTFIDLNEEAKNFFGSDIPFWDEPEESTSALSSPTMRRRSSSFTLPPKIGVWDRFVYSFKKEQKKLKSAESNELYKQSNKNNDSFFDCASPALRQRQSQSFILPSNEESSISSNELESVEF